MVEAKFLQPLILLDNFRSDFTARADFARFRETLPGRAKFFQIRRFLPRLLAFVAGVVECSKIHPKRL